MSARRPISGRPANVLRGLVDRTHQSPPAIYKPFRRVQIPNQNRQSRQTVNRMSTAYSHHSPSETRSLQTHPALPEHVAARVAVPSFPIYPLHVTAMASRTRRPIRRRLGLRSRLRRIAAAADSVQRLAPSLTDAAVDAALNRQWSGNRQRLAAVRSMDFDSHIRLRLRRQGAEDVDDLPEGHGS